MGAIWTRVTVREGDTDAEFVLPDMPDSPPGEVALEITGKYSSFVEVFKRGSLELSWNVQRDGPSRILIALDGIPSGGNNWLRLPSISPMCRRFTAKVHFVPALPPMLPVELQLMFRDGKKET